MPNTSICCRCGTSDNGKDVCERCKRKDRLRTAARKVCFTYDDNQILAIEEFIEILKDDGWGRALDSLGEYWSKQLDRYHREKAGSISLLKKGTKDGVSKEAIKKGLDKYYNCRYWWEFKIADEFINIEVQIANVQAIGLSHVTPRWDAERRELWFGDTLCKRFRQPAKNQVRILVEFQESGWVTKIDDPLPGDREIDTRQRPADTVHKLNNNPCLVFELDGTSEAILWSIKEIFTS